MFTKLMLRFLTKDLDTFSKDLVFDVVLGNKEFRPMQVNETLTLDEMAELDNEYASYL